MDAIEKRARFEAWAKTTYTINRGIDGQYLNVHTEDAWHAWQAALTPQWQPIESAPKDGTFILAVAEGFAPTVAQWSTKYRPEGAFEFLAPDMFAEEKHWQAALDSSDVWKPTHWMPLPAPPEAP